MRIKTIGAAANRFNIQGAADRATTEGWNAQARGEHPSANPYDTAQPEHYYWAAGWRARNQICAERGSDDLILYVGVGRHLRARR